MSSSSAATEVSQANAITLRGTKHGLEVHVDGCTPTAWQVTDELRAQLVKAPGFFRGADVIVRFAGAPPPGVLGPLEQLAQEFGLRIVGVRSDAEAKQQAERAALAAVAALESEPPADPVATPQPVAESAQATSEPDPIEPEPIVKEQERRILTGTTRMVVGPVRSGFVLEATGDVTIIGDVNPGAEVRAGGSIVVLGALRGVAHAARAQGKGFILALHLAPQQLRIGALVARASDSDQPIDRPEIAYASGRQIVVDEYLGKLPAKW